LGPGPEGSREKKLQKIDNVVGSQFVRIRSLHVKGSDSLSFKGYLSIVAFGRDDCKENPIQKSIFVKAVFGDIIRKANDGVATCSKCLLPVHLLQAQSFGKTGLLQ
jgi:hypothetical protein